MKVKKRTRLQLSNDDLLRYNKHILLEEIQTDGLEILKQKHVAIIGLGGLGCPVAQYLSTSGLGKITLIDDDVVDETNLQRQILYTSEDLGLYKADVACKRLKILNPDINIEGYNIRFTNDSVSLMKDVDIIIDATDNFKSRSLINKISLFLKKPLVMGAAIKMQGQVAVFRNDLSDMPCYNCLYDDIEDEINSCIDLGVLSTLTGMIGSLQATEVIKTLIGFGESLESKLLLVDLKYMGFRTVKIIKDNKCKVCN
ncbi:MAG: HesA/MoeB/ThiF family protein [Gammaproteobacteria bacterium]|nr:HesA/MoeB/ThiF family protein [Gammaproteobacteria bacterium]|tara:strand:- start:17732 stop:18499 length:768 start_codon:yes stop_codon:yes gene_type:complete